MNKWCAAAILTLGLVAAACSHSEPKPASGQLPQVILVREAIAALETELGGAQSYFEVNATPTLVNLFVSNADASQATAYIYFGGELQKPQDPQPASGPTFQLAQLAYDDATVLNKVAAELPDSVLRLFSVVGVMGGGVKYLITTESPQGGQLEIPVTDDGTIIPAGG